MPRPPITVALRRIAVLLVAALLTACGVQPETETPAGAGPPSERHDASPDHRVGKADRPTRHAAERAEHTSWRRQEPVPGPRHATSASAGVGVAGPTAVEPDAPATTEADDLGGAAPSIPPSPPVPPGTNASSTAPTSTAATSTTIAASTTATSTTSTTTAASTTATSTTSTSTPSTTTTTVPHPPTVTTTSTPSPTTSSPTTPSPTTSSPTSSSPTTSSPPGATTIPPAPNGPFLDIPSNVDLTPFITTGGARPESSASEPSGNFRLICEVSHLAYDDPIVFPGRPGASHLHMFFGNTGADAWSTFASLRTTGDSTCQGGPANRSAYWSPAVLDVDGDVVMPEFVSVYYKGPARDPDGTLLDVVSLPPGLRMIAGDDMAQPDDWGHFDWYCELTQRKQTTIPSCPSGERVGVVLAFPTCWDGAHLDSTDHRSHLAYGQRNTSSGVVSCPASHPVPIPEFTVGIWFPNDGASRDWYLSSDRMGGMIHPNGSTFHADWFGAWDPDVRDTWTEECINGLRNCSGGSLGDGRQLVAATDYRGPSKVPAPPR